MKRGIVAASDLTQEWILPWWWDNYRKHNSYPVAFVDLGMSFEMKAWCKKRGELIPLRVVDFASGKEEIDPPLAKQWKEDHGTFFWDYRNAWFKKPLACLKSPFQKTIWIDIDCEIRGALQPLFKYEGLAMAKDWNNASKEVYNSGVIVFDQGSLPLIQEWADGCFKDHASFPGDQDILSDIIAKKGVRIGQIPDEYNWSRCREVNPDAIINHWHGPIGKFIIRHLRWRA